MLDELVTRRRAFTSQSVPGLYFSKLHEEPVRPSERSDDLPAAWKDTISTVPGFQTGCASRERDGGSQFVDPSRYGEVTAIEEAPSPNAQTRGG